MRIIFTILFLLASFTSFAQGRLNDPKYLQAYYRLAGDALDYSGNGRHGTWSGTEAYQSGPYGKDVGKFSSSRIATQYTNTNSTVTVSFWLKASSPVQNIISTDKFLINTGAGTTFKITVSSDGSGAVTATSFLPTNQWINVIVVQTVSGATATENIYYNGKLDKTGTTAYVVPSVPYSIGAYPNNTVYLNGNLSNVRIYNVALSPAEIEQLYTLDSRPSVPQIALEQPFDTLPDRSDPTLMGAWLNSATVNSANDYSVNGRNGTATSVTWQKTGARFNGTSSRINLNSPILPTTNATFTISATFLTTDSSTTAALLGTSGGGANRAAITLTSGTIGYYKGGISRNVVNISANQYYVITIVKESNYYTKLYLNGSYVNTSVDAETAGVENFNLYIGDLVYLSRYFKGLIKDVRIYSEAKSASWVAQEYAKSVPDDSIQLYLWNGKDYSKNARQITNYKVSTGSGPMRFNGSDSYLSTPDFIGTNDFTATVWFRANSHGEGSDGGRFIDAGNIIFKLKATKQYAYTSNGGATEYAVNGTYLFPQWMCVSVIRNGSTCYIYQNGSLIGSGSSGTPGATSTFYIGNTSAFTKTFDGLLGPLIIRSRVQTADEIKAEYESLKTYF